VIEIAERADELDHAGKIALGEVLLDLEHARFFVFFTDAYIFLQKRYADVASVGSSVFVWEYNVFKYRVFNLFNIDIVSTERNPFGCLIVHNNKLAVLCHMNVCFYSKITSVSCRNKCSTGILAFNA
jgi:hypothetical protein